MKFESIKAKAKLIYGGALDQWPWFGTTKAHLGLGTLKKGNGPAFDALLPFVLATKSERDEMRVFAEAFESNPKDWLACAAKAKDVARLDVAWNQMVLRARQAGFELIDKWDVRKVDKLIELFPDCVPAEYRNKPVTCYMADNDDCDWMVEVEQRQPEQGPQRSRPTMRT